MCLPGYPSVPPTPVPTTQQWFSLNATTDFGAKGGDRITMKGTGLDADKEYRCRFWVYRYYGRASRGNLRIEEYARLYSDWVRPSDFRTISCITPVP